MKQQSYVICDIEATGLDEDKEIIEIALITYKDGKVTEVYETLINPLRNVSNYIQDLTGLEARELETAPKFYDVADSIRLRLEGQVFVSHNTEFDLSLLRKKFQELGQTLSVKSFCTLRVAQHEIPGLKSYSLAALCDFFRIKYLERHRAHADALATLELFKELLPLRLKVKIVPRFLNHHEKCFKKIAHGAGLLIFKDTAGKTVKYISAFDMLKEARELLEVRPDNRELLVQTESVEAEATGSALIAEMRRLLYHPYHPNWMIVAQDIQSGEKILKIRPYAKAIPGLWYFRHYQDAKIKLNELVASLKDDRLVYREGSKTKEEIVRHNQKLEQLMKEAKFPAENLVLIGEGRTLGERSVVLVRKSTVMGYGYTFESEEAILEHPENFIQKRYFRHLGVDLAARRYLKVLKNLRQKTEKWRSLSHQKGL